MNNKKMLMPEYANRFKCIGGKCENNCCQGWDIFIDKNTYKKYKKIKNGDLKYLVNDSLILNKESKFDSSYSKIKLDDNGICPFLDENGLCKIHKNCGEELLSHTCKTYPKVYNKVGETVEMSYYISCPEVARLALLNPSKMSFNEIDIIKNFIYYPQKKISEREDMLWMVRIFTIDILQNRDYKIWERLIILGLFFEQSSEYIKNYNKEQVLKFIESFNYLLNTKEITGILNQYETDIDYQFEMIKIMYEARMKFDVKDKVFTECMSEFNKGLKVDEVSAEEQHKLYIKNYEDYFLPFVDSHEYIFENYLVQYIFTQFFAVGNDDNSFDEYCLLVLNFVLVKTFLVGMSGFHKNINEELVIKLVHSFHRTYHHGVTLIQYVYNKIKENNRITMKHITLLLKS